jgi:hypothetical protein
MAKIIIIVYFRNPTNVIPVSSRSIFKQSPFLKPAEFRDNIRITNKNPP